jgi:uncharacterized delta-60 repeat protein
MCRVPAAGEVHAAKQVPPRPGLAPALGLRAGNDGVFIVSQTNLPRRPIMFFSSWLRKKNPLGQRVRRTAPRRSAGGFQPRLEILEDRCVPSAGFLDSTFNTTGVATTQVAPFPSFSESHAVATYAPGTANAGKTVSVGLGADSTGKYDAFGLVRYNPDGSLDSTFGTGGIVNNTLGGNSWASAVATVGDKILVGGRYTSTSHSKSSPPAFALARFNPDGSLDQTFGSGGTVFTSISRYGADALEIAVQTDGKIVLSGLMFTIVGKSGYWDFAVARYTPNGVLDTTFGSGGQVTVDVGASLTPDSESGSQEMDMALSGDRIDLAGYAFNPQNMYVAQLTATGQLDPSFGVGGVVKGPQCNDLALATQSDGKVVVAYKDSIVYGKRVIRFLANGSPDTTFGVGGIVTVPDPSPAYDTFFAIKVDPMGRFVIGGWQQTTTDNITKLMVLRLTSAGALDSSFGVGGIGTSGSLVNLNSTYAEVAMALQSDGKPVLVSTTQDYKFAAARFDGDAPLLAAAVSRAASAEPLSIGDGDDNMVKGFDAATRADEGMLVSSGSGGLDGPRGLIFGEHHDLLVINQNVFTTLGGEVLRHDGQTGAFINQVVADGDLPNPYDPRGMVRGPHHSLFIGDLGDLGNLDGTGRSDPLAQLDE